jgi:WD40-like Beta Propeller Repeat
VRRIVVLFAVAALAAASHGADDGTAQRVVGGAGSNAMPAWTPDGSRIIFHARRKAEKQREIATRNVWSVAADGQAERRLTKGNKDEYHASLAPDGKHLLFVAEINGSRDVWISDAEGQNPVPLTDDPGTEDQPAWSPDSRRIAYAAFPKEGGSFDLWVVNVDGSGRRRLTTTPANEIFPAWHPNGEDIAYVTDASGNFDLYRMSVRDGATSPLVVSPDHEARPAWSPDGGKLAFARWPAQGRSTDSTLWIANADGTAPIELSAAPAPATHPAWSPDGATLAFQHRASAGWEIWTLALPRDIAQAGRLRLAQQLRGGADVDTAKLRNGDTLRGTVEETRFRVRAAYGALELPRNTVASILFAPAERGLARVVLANGDTVSGFVETTEIRLTAGSRAERVAMERVAELSLRGTQTPPSEGAFRAVMRNGDSLLLRAPFGPLHLRVGDGTTTIEGARLERVEFDEGGERATAVMRGGDSVTGKLPGDRIELTLAIGARVVVHPSQLRTVARIAPPARATGAGG